MLGTQIVVAALAALVAGSPIDKRQDIPILSVPVIQLISPNISAAHIIEADRGRHAAYYAHVKHGKRQTSVSAKNQIVSYVANVGIGSGSNTYSLIVDTGSSNTWCGANKAYVKTSTSVNTGHSVSVSYGSGSFSGTEYTDTVTLGVAVTGQSIGVASKSTGFSGVNGIIGFGPEDLTTNTVSGVSQVPTFMQNAAAQRKIPANILGVSFAPASTSGTANGVLTLGGTLSSQYTGSIAYQTVTSTQPAGEYWGVTVKFLAGGQTLASSASGIVDTGTTLVYLPTDAASKYFANTGFTLDSSTGLYRSTSASGAKDLVIPFGGTTFTWRAANTLVPSSEYAALGLTSGYYYSWINDYGQSSTSSGLSFIIGQKFLEFFYSVYDTPNNRVGLATTSRS